MPEKAIASALVTHLGVHVGRLATSVGMAEVYIPAHCTNRNVLMVEVDNEVFEVTVTVNKRKG